jgi:predicted TIM-barrel fold metal-dependent hydrolase
VAIVDELKIPGLDKLTSREVAGDLLISADSHIFEPSDLWRERLPAELREKAPYNERGNQQRKQTNTAGFSNETRGAFRPGGWDPSQRLAEMAQDGVSGEVLFPTVGLGHYAMEDAELQEACFRVYNDWLHEYCQVAPDRLWPVACISTYDIDHAIAEMERCARLGFVGAMIWQVPPPHLPFLSDHYERFWAAAEAMEMPVDLHILTGFDYSSRERGNPVEVRRGAANHKTAGAFNTLFDIIFSGVLDRYPRLTINLVESEIGWIPFMLHKWDTFTQRFQAREPVDLELLPSEYFTRQISATFFDDPVGCKILGYWGSDNCMWSTDYPHPTSTWPKSRELLVENLGHLPRETLHKLVRDNVTRFYNITAPTPLTEIQ